MATETTLEYRRGDSRNYRILITDSQSTPAPIDLSGAVVRFTVKRRPTDPQSDALIALSTYDGAILVTNAVGGEILVQVPPGSTHGARAGEYCWDLEIIRQESVLSSAGSADVETGSQVITLSDLSAVAVAQPGYLIDLTNAVSSANQKLLAITATPSTDSTLSSNQIRTDYSGLVTESTIAPLSIISGDVKTPVGLSGVFNLLPDVTV